MIKNLNKRLKEYYAFVKQSYRNQELEKLNASSELQRRYAGMMEETQKSIFKREEFRAYSQNGEDGLLLFIFSKIGTTNKTTIEFGVGDGSQCNSANLILNFGWNGLFMEGNQTAVNRGLNYYKHKGINSLQFKNVFITAENINQLITDNGISGEIDLLNVDIDGNDYWVWQAINVVNPRVVVVEYNSSFGSEKSVSVPYAPDFNRWQKHPSGWYHGASLSALTKLGNQKGYDLVACDSCGVNAFFVRKDINPFKSLSAFEAYYPELKRQLKSNNSANQLQAISELPLQEV